MLDGQRHASLGNIPTVLRVDSFEVIGKNGGSEVIRFGLHAEGRGQGKSMGLGEVEMSATYAVSGAWRGDHLNPACGIDRYSRMALLGEMVRRARSGYH